MALVENDVQPRQCTTDNVGESRGRWNPKIPSGRPPASRYTQISTQTPGDSSRPHEVESQDRVEAHLLVPPSRDAPALKKRSLVKPETLADPGDLQAGG